MAAVLVALVPVSAIGYVVLLPVPRFPKPTGPYGIGTRVYHWVDDSRQELFTAAANDRRELIAQVWYPAHTRIDSPRAAYVADGGPVVDALAALFRVPGWMLGNLRRAVSNSVADAPPALDEVRYPVLIFLSGFGGYRSSSSFQIEELVSRGYVVVGLDQPGSAAVTVLPGGRHVPMLDKSTMDVLLAQSVAPKPVAPVLNGVPLPNGILPYLAADVSFALDQMTVLDASDPVLGGHLDITRAGVFGMSLGGYIGPEACLRDPRLKAVLATDAAHAADVIHDGLAQPIMILTRHAEVMRQERAAAGGWSDHDIKETIETQQQLYARNRGPAYLLNMDTMFHLNWTDGPRLTPLLGFMGLNGPIAPQRGFDITNAYTAAFFDRYLAGRVAPLLDGPSRDFPEVQFNRRNSPVEGPIR